RGDGTVAGRSAHSTRGTRPCTAEQIPDVLDTYEGIAHDWHYRFEMASVRSRTSGGVGDVATVDADQPGADRGAHRRQDIYAARRGTGRRSGEGRHRDLLRRRAAAA